MKKIIAFASVFAFIGILATAQEKAPAAKDGKTIFTEAKCTMCHSVKSLNVESPKKDKAIDLSIVGDKVKADEFKTYLKKESKINDKNHPMPFKGADEDLKTLASWLESLKTPAAK